MNTNNLGWLSIFRLGIVQAALGAIVVLTTSTLNRVMVVEVGLAAMIPGALVTLHHAMQLLRPRMGFGSDIGKRRTPWIIGGMGTLALGGVTAAIGTAVMKTNLTAGLAIGALGFALIGIGVSAAGTSLLVLMAKRVASDRRAAAATIVWMMMILGFAMTAGFAGKLLDPYSPLRLVQVAGGVSLLAFVLSVIGIWGVEGKGTPVAEVEAEPAEVKLPFRQALAQVWAESDARRFTIFIAISMISYSAQDLVLEPFAGAHFGFSPGESTRLSGVQHGGVFAGMLLVALATTLLRSTAAAGLKQWVVGGCMASALAMGGLVVGGLQNGPWPVKANVFLLGLANGVFCIAAIGSMMALATRGRSGREGVRMGLWGAAQAIAFGAGGFLGTLIVDAGKFLGLAPGPAAAVVFGLEVIGFLVAQWFALGVQFDAPVKAAEAAGRQPVPAEQPVGAA